MTDQDLIAWLRDLAEALGKEAFTRAADRIEQLEIRNKELTLQLLAAHGQAADALDKLAKAVEALRYYAVEAMPWDADDSLVARTALAELEGK